MTIYHKIIISTNILNLRVHNTYTFLSVITQNNTWILKKYYIKMRIQKTSHLNDGEITCIKQKKIINVIESIYLNKIK